VAEEQAKTVVRASIADAAEEHPISSAVELVPMSMAKMILIRTLRVYVQTLVALLLAGGTGAAAQVGVIMPVGDFWALLAASASLSLASAGITFLQNVLELLARLDVTHPAMRA